MSHHTREFLQLEGVVKIISNTARGKSAMKTAISGISCMGASVNLHGMLCRGKTMLAGGKNSVSNERGRNPSEVQSH